MSDKVREDERELLEAFDALYKAHSRAMRALINRITVISMADQLDAAKLREEVAHLRKLFDVYEDGVRAKADDFDEGHP